MHESKIILMFLLALLTGISIGHVFDGHNMWFWPLIISAYGVGILVAEFIES